MSQKVRAKAEADLATVRMFPASEVATLCIDVKTDRYTFLIFYSSIKFLLEDASSFKPGNKSTLLRVWRAGSVVKNVCCSWKGSELFSLYLHGGS